MRNRYLRPSLPWRALALWLICSAALCTFGQQPEPASSQTNPPDQTPKATAPRLLATITNQTETIETRRHAIQTLHEAGFEDAPLLHALIPVLTNSSEN